MCEYCNEVTSRYKENSFHNLFWKEQLKNLAKQPKQHRWNPMLVRWSLHLRILSSSAYDTLRRVLMLLCGRILRDYTHYIKEGIGIQPEVTQQFLTAIKYDTLEDHQKNVSVIFDEMKVKEDLVYNKHQYKVVGFGDVGAINNTLQMYEQTLTDPHQSMQPVIAKHMLVFMV